jgi:hypothetical protein
LPTSEADESASYKPGTVRLLQTRGVSPHVRDCRPTNTEDQTQTVRREWGPPTRNDCIKLTGHSFDQMVV